MWTSRIFRKLFLVMAGLSFALTAAFLWCLATWQSAMVVAQAKATLMEKAHGIIRTAAAADATNIRAALSNEVDAALRASPQAVVLVDEQGKFLAGSGANRELLSRSPEILSAIRGEEGQSIATAPGGRLLHVTVPVRQGSDVVGALRVSQDLGSIDEQFARTQRLLGIFVVVAVGLATIAVYFIVGRMVRPLAELTEAAQAIVESDQRNSLFLVRSDELGVLGQALNQIQRKFDARVERLEESAERLTSVLGNMAEGVVAVSPAENILLANGASRKLLEMTVADPINRPLLEVIRSRTVHAAFVEALKSTAPVEREFELAGSRRVLSLRAMRLPGNPCPGVVLVLHDVSELRRLESLRREFVANVSHELKTPLASIKAYAETLKMGAINDPEHSLLFVNRIEEQAERLHQLILDLIHLARVESGQEAFEISNIDLGDVVQDCLDQHAAAATQKQLLLEPIAPDAPVTALADEEGLRTMLSNLIDNAIKYTPKGGQITVRWGADARGALLEVKDTGIGIAERDQARIFERFYRVDKARSREVGGTGLGLAIVKHLAQAFGGSVELESIPKQGSTFRIRLLSERHSPAALHAAPASS